MALAANSLPIEAATVSVCAAALVANWDTGSTAALLTVANWSEPGGVVLAAGGWLSARGAAGAVPAGVFEGFAGAMACGGVLAGAGAGLTAAAGAVAGTEAGVLFGVSLKSDVDLPQPPNRLAARIAVPEITIVRLIGRRAYPRRSAWQGSLRAGHGMLVGQQAEMAS